MTKKTRQLNKLSALFVKNVKYDDPNNPRDGKKAKNKHPDGGGMYLLVKPNNSKYWHMDYYRPIKGRNTLAFGVYNTVTLEMARLKRDEARRLLDGGVDPSEHKKEIKQQLINEHTNTFEPLAREWLAIRAHENKEDFEVIRRLEKDVFPYIGKKPVSTLTTVILEKEVTDRIVERGALTLAKKVKSSIKMILELARKRKLISDNPAIDITLPAPVKGNYPALIEPVQVAEMVKDAWSYELRPRVQLSTAQALKLSILFFLRPTEIRSMKWSSLDREAKTIEVVTLKTDAKGKKKSKTLIVPLARQAIEILDRLYLITGSSGYVFYSPRGKEPYLSDGAVREALKRMGYGGEQTPHGFRATARTMIDERLKKFRPDWIEQQLAHVVKDPNGTAYNRTKHLDDRTKMMQAWANYVDKLRLGKI